MMPFTTSFCYHRHKGRVGDWRVVQGNAKIVFTATEEEVRRGGISFDKKDQNAIYVRMLGDVRMKPKPEQAKEKQRSVLSEAEVRLLDGLSSKTYKSRWSSRFRTMRKRRSKKSCGTLMSPDNLSLLDKQYCYQAQCILSNASTWDLNIFTLDLLTCGRPLFHIAVHLFQHYDLINKFNLDIVKLLRTFSLIEDGYHDNNPYHNAVHAADVTQAMHCYLQEEELNYAVPPFEVMTSLLAAMTHDLDHPGVNQTFLIATSNHLASLYQNTSVLENHHWRTAVGVLYETGLFSHLCSEQLQEIEWQLKSLVLATDITRQQEFMSKFRKLLESGDLDCKNNPEHRHFMLQIALKCADICNPCREWSLSKQWSERVCEEFFRQGDYEGSIHIPVTPMCNRHTNTVANIQSGFMQYVVYPLFQEWHHFLPSKLSKDMLKNIEINQTKWQAVLQEEQKQASLGKEEGEDSSSLEDENVMENLEEEMSDIVKESRLPLNFTHLADNDEENSQGSSRRGSCRSLSPLREISENGWDPEQRRHSMPPTCLRREITCVTIRRDSVPSSHYHRRRSLPTAMIVHASSLDKMSGKLSAYTSHKYSVGEVSMEELLSRPKISNLTLNYETSRLASGLSDVSQHRVQGSNIRFRTVPEIPKVSHITEHIEKENIPVLPSQTTVISSDTFQTSPALFAQNVECANITAPTSTEHASSNCVNELSLMMPVIIVEEEVGSGMCSKPSRDKVNEKPWEDSSVLPPDVSMSLQRNVKPASLSQ